MGTVTMPVDPLDAWYEQMYPHKEPKSFAHITKGRCRSRDPKNTRYEAMCSPPPETKSPVFTRRQQAGTRFTKPCASKRSNCITRSTPRAVAPTRIRPAKSDPTD